MTKVKYQLGYRIYLHVNFQIRLHDVFGKNLYKNSSPSAISNLSSALCSELLGQKLKGTYRQAHSICPPDTHTCVWRIRLSVRSGESGGDPAINLMADTGPPEPNAHA